MKKQGRYSTSGLVEDQYMPGSKNKVLQNLLGIATKKEIDRIETELLFEITDQLLDEFDNTRQFSADDILEMHRRWLGSVYEWAGKYRQVMMSKGNFMFAAPAYIPQLMAEISKKKSWPNIPHVSSSQDRRLFLLWQSFTRNSFSSIPFGKEMAG
jgi:cell filamentation protein